MSRDLSPEEREHAIALHKRYRREGRVDIESLLVAELSKPGLRTVSRFQVSRCIADWKEEQAIRRQKNQQQTRRNAPFSDSVTEATLSNDMKKRKTPVGLAADREAAARRAQAAQARLLAHAQQHAQGDDEEEEDQAVLELSPTSSGDSAAGRIVRTSGRQLNAGEQPPQVVPQPSPSEAAPGSPETGRTASPIFTCVSPRLPCVLSDVQCCSSVFQPETGC